MGMVVGRGYIAEFSFFKLSKINLSLAVVSLFVEIDFGRILEKSFYVVVVISRGKKITKNAMLTKLFRKTKILVLPTVPCRKLFHLFCNNRLWRLDFFQNWLWFINSFHLNRALVIQKISFLISKKKQLYIAYDIMMYLFQFFVVPQFLAQHLEYLPS